jgi:hypothetical protein
MCVGVVAAVDDDDGSEHISLPQRESWFHVTHAAAAFRQPGSLDMTARRDRMQNVEVAATNARDDTKAGRAGCHR